MENLTTSNPTHMKKSYYLTTARTCVLLYEDKPPPDTSSTGLPNNNWLGQAWSLYLVLSEKLSFFWGNKQSLSNLIFKST